MCRNCWSVCVGVEMESKSLDTGSCGIIFWMWVRAWTEEDLHRSCRCSHRRIAAASPHRTTLLQHRSIAAASQQIHFRTASPRHGRTAGAVPHRHAAPSFRAAPPPHRSMVQHRRSLPDRCRFAAAPPHSRSSALQHRRHFRTSQPRRTTV